MLYSWGNNSRCQCGFDFIDNNNNKIIKNPKNIIELNDKNINNKYISRINSEETIMTYFKENSFFPEIKFPSMGDKSTSNIFLFFFQRKIFYIFNQIYIFHNKFFIK
jgi:hypothetical protein